MEGRTDQTPGRVSPLRADLRTRLHLVAHSRGLCAACLSSSDLLRLHVRVPIFREQSPSSMQLFSTHFVLHCFQSRRREETYDVGPTCLLLTALLQWRLCRAHRDSSAHSSRTDQSPPSQTSSRRGRRSTHV